MAEWTATACIEQVQPNGTIFLMPLHALQFRHISMKHFSEIGCSNGILTSDAMRDVMALAMRTPATGVFTAQDLKKAKEGGWFYAETNHIPYADHVRRFVDLCVKYHYAIQMTDSTEVPASPHDEHQLVNLPAMPVPPNPLQPLHLDPHGVLRFKANKIVRDMLDFSTPRGFDMNHIAWQGDKYSQDDKMQFAQLIGYSHAGYSDLSYASEESIGASDLMYTKGLTEEQARVEFLREAFKSLGKQFAAPVEELNRMTKFLENEGEDE